MGIEINLSNLNIRENAAVMNHATIQGGEDVRISVVDTDVSGEAKLLENLEINTVLEELRKQAQRMEQSSPEYIRIQEILSVEQWSRGAFLENIKRHLGDFAQGVLASVVAGYITKG